MIKAVIFDCFGVVLDVIRNTRQEPVIEFIRSLKGEYRLGMMSNVTSRRSLDDRFAPGELDELFEVVMASGDIGFEKPHPAIYEMTAERLGVKPEECLFVDDIGRFTAAAEATGMKAVTFTDPRASIDEIKRQLGVAHADHH